MMINTQETPANNVFRPYSESIHVRLNVYVKTIPAMQVTRGQWDIFDRRLDLPIPDTELHLGTEEDLC